MWDRKIYVAKLFLRSVVKLLIFCINLKIYSKRSECGQNGHNDRDDNHILKRNKKLTN